MLTALLLCTLVPAALADEISAEIQVQSLPGGEIASGLGARLDGGGGFVSIEGRGLTERAWLGRATAGVDLLGGAESVDLTLGLFLGTLGGWPRPEVHLAGTGGFELGVGLNVGGLHGRYRHADGFSGPFEQRLTENEWRLGYRMLGTVEVFGQYVRFNPDEERVIAGYGMGAALVF